LTPLPTAVQVAKVVRAQESGSSGLAQRRSARKSSPESVLLYVAAAAVMGALVLTGVASWVWRRAKQAEDTPDRG
jgi:hypothetical protein